MKETKLRDMPEFKNPEFGFTRDAEIGNWVCGKEKFPWVKMRGELALQQLNVSRNFVPFLASIFFSFFFWKNRNSFLGFFLKIKMNYDKLEGKYFGISGVDDALDFSRSDGLGNLGTK